MFAKSNLILKKKIFIILEILFSRIDNIFIYCICHHQLSLFNKFKINFSNLLSYLSYQFKLDNFQLVCLTLLNFNVDIFVAAHTSSGKTLIAEQVIYSSLRLNKKIIYLSPIKALSNQKFEDFKKIFYSVGIITGDQTLNSEANCIVMTTEIFRLFLFNNSSWLNNISYIIIDEAHFIFDDSRGFIWEELIISTPLYMNIVYLSATVTNIMEISEWIFLTRNKVLFTVKTEKRSIPLLNYIYLTNINKLMKLEFYLKNKDIILNNSNKDKKIYRKKNISRLDFHFLITLLKDKNLLPVIYFIFSKKKCFSLSKSFLKISLLNNQEKILLNSFFKRIYKYKIVFSNSNLFHSYKNFWILLMNGVAVHNSDISQSCRKLVEILFESNLIKILFATETFSIGLNMPAKTVVFNSIKKFDGDKIRPLKNSEFIQMSGRAGRRGIDKRGYVFSIFKNMTDIQILESVMKKFNFCQISIYKLSIFTSLKLSILDKADIKKYFSLLLSNYQNKNKKKVFKTKISFLSKRKLQILCHLNENYFLLSFIFIFNIDKYLQFYLKLTLPIIFNSVLKNKKTISKKKNKNIYFFFNKDKFFILNKSTALNLVKNLSYSLVLCMSSIYENFQDLSIFLKLSKLKFSLCYETKINRKDPYLFEFKKILKGLENMWLISFQQKLNKKAYICLKSGLDENLILLELIYNGFFLKDRIEITTSILCNFEIHLEIKLKMNNLFKFIKTSYNEFIFYAYKIYKNFKKTIHNLKYYKFKNSRNTSRINYFYLFLNKYINSRSICKSSKINQKIKNNLGSITEFLHKISVAYELIGDLHQSLKFKNYEFLLRSFI